MNSTHNYYSYLIITIVVFFFLPCDGTSTRSAGTESAVR